MAEPSYPVPESSLSPIDTPLQDPSQDLLGRSRFARGLAQGILQMDAEHGFVVALHGPWGSGKSTTLNFVLHYIRVDSQ
jgi:predicted KAP-like P-loop ATPase